MRRCGKEGFLLWLEGVLERPGQWQAILEGVLPTARSGWESFKTGMRVRCTISWEENREECGWLV